MTNEYICKHTVIDYLNGYLYSIGEYKSDNLFDMGQRNALINSIQDISTVKAADVQPLSVVAEHIKNRLYETAFNTNEPVASNIIVDMAERVDYWINELNGGETE